MTENIVRSYREKLGYTQVVLAEKTGLSLRTIQRVESGAMIPKGHTLTQLASVFGVEPSELQTILQPEKNNSNQEKIKLKLLNFSALGFFILPFGNLIFPLWIWLKNAESEFIERQGRTIINFQIIWSVCLCISLCIAPFIDVFPKSYIPLILWVLLVFVLFNCYMIFKIAKAIKNDRNPILKLPFHIL